MIHMETRLFYIHALTALHMGTGQGIDVIDLPIARDQASGLPIVPGSGLKGVLRDELAPANGDDDTLWPALFGPTTRQAEDAEAHAGALALADAQLLCLPVRSAFGTFAWVTSPWILRRYRRDLGWVGAKGVPDAVPEVDDAQVAVTADSALRRGDGPVVFEELDLRPAGDTASAGAWARWIATRVFEGEDDWARLFGERFAVVSDAVMDFLAQTATEVRARVRIAEDTRTVAKGALWYEENLPPESLFWGWLTCSRSRRPKDERGGAELLHAFRERLGDDACRLQLGGKATVGRGQVRWILPAEED